MSTSGTHLTIDEREKLLIFRTQGLGIRAIARLLDRDPSSISRELQRNAAPDGSYSARQAQQNYEQRRKKCVRQQILADPKLNSEISARLEECWSPEQIAGRRKLEESEQQVSFSTIYRAIHSGLVEVSKKCLRRGGRKPSPHKDETRGRLHGQKTIQERPEAANERSECGHWEGDTVHGAAGKGVIATFVDRMSGFLVAALMPDRKAQTLNEAAQRAFAAFPDSLKKSFTVDNGNEFFAYQDFEKALHTSVYFADPYSPWQRGVNENTNGLLRQKFPKKCDLLQVSEEEFQAVITALNNRPRKRLGYRTPAECFPLDQMLHLE